MMIFRLWQNALMDKVALSPSTTPRHSLHGRPQPVAVGVSGLFLPIDSFFMIFPSSSPIYGHVHTDPVEILVFNNM